MNVVEPDLLVKRLAELRRRIDALILSHRREVSTGKKSIADWLKEVEIVQEMSNSLLLKEFDTQKRKAVLQERISRLRRV